MTPSTAASTCFAAPRYVQYVTASSTTVAVETGGGICCIFVSPTTCIGLTLHAAIWRRASNKEQALHVAPLQALLMKPFTAFVALLYDGSNLVSFVTSP